MAKGLYLIFVDRICLALLCLFVILFTAPNTVAQVSITSSTPVTQNFDAMGSSGTASIPSGFKVSNGTTANFSAASAAATLAAGTTGTGVLSGSSSGGFYNLANGVTASATDRAVGFLTSGSFASPCYLFMQLQNNTGSTITALNITFVYEKYRNGTRQFDMAFQASSDGTTFGSAVSAGAQSYGADANNTTISNPPAATAKTVSLSSLSIANGSYYYIRWSYTGLSCSGSGCTNGQAIGIDSISVTATLAAAGCSGTPAHATSSTGTGSVCAGSTASLSLSGYSSGTGYVYQWQSSATGSSGTYTDISSATNTAYTSGTLSATTYYRCITTCTTASTYDTSSATTITVNPVVTPSVTITASPSGAVCSGTTVTFTATPVNGGSTPAYQWKKGGVTISGATNVTYAYAPANGDVISCLLTSSAVCPSPSTATSSGITLTVNALPAPTISGTATISSGGSTALTFTGTSGDTVYYWDGSTSASTTISGGSSSVTVSPTVTTTYSVTTATSSAGCSQSVTGQYAIVTVSTGSPSDTIPTRDNNMAMGNPSSATTATSDSNNYLMVKSQFALSYNNSRGLPNWVSWHLSRAWKGSAVRCDCFTQDGSLPTGYYRASTSNYTGTGFDRGHLCPSDDRDGSDSDNTATFLMDNITPQAPFLNQQTWGNLEDYCRGLLDLGNELYIIAGDYGSGGTGSAGGTTTSIASGRIIVPSHFWKAVVVLPVGINDVSRVTTSTRVFAIDMPNLESVSTEAWESYKISIDSLETLTGYNLLSNVTSSVQNVIEAKPEVTVAGWDFTSISSPSSVVATTINAKMDTSTSSSMNTMVRGSGASASSGTNSFRTTGFGSDGISTSNTDYFQFKLKPASGHTVTISSIDAAFGGTSSFYGSPGVTSQLAYSFNGTSFTLIGTPITSTSLGQQNFDCSSVTALRNIPSSSTVYFRYYASGQTSGGGWGLNSVDTGVYGLSVNGYFDQGCTGTPAAGTVSASPTGVCTGGSSTLSLTGYSSGSSYTYQWQSSTGGSFSNISGATGTTYITPALSTNTVYKCITTCTSVATTNTSPADTVMVTAYVTPSVTFAASPSGAVCAGTSVTYNATPVNGGTTPAYQWKKNNVSISGATNSTYAYVPANSDTITCQMTSSLACPSPATVMSPALIASVTATVTPSVSIAASPAGAVCNGASVTYTATPTNGGASPAYQWRHGISAIAGATNSTYTYTPADGDSVACTMTSNASCPAPSSATSSNIIAIVSPTTPVVNPITGTLNTSVGASTTLSNTTSGGTWSSAASSVATVSSSGVVTGVALGSAIISYSVTTACGSNFDTAIVVVAVPSAAAISDTAWSGMTAASATGASSFASLPAGTTPGSSVVNVSQWNRNIITNNAGTGFYNSQNWSTGASLAVAQSEGKYIWFTITNSSSTEVKLTKLNIIGQKSSTGPATLQAQYRVAGSSTDQNFGSTATPSTTSGNLAFTGTLCIAPGQSDTIKVYGWGATSSAGTFRVANGSFIYATYVTGVAQLAVTSSSNSGPVCAGSSLSFSGGTASNGLTPYSYAWAGPSSYSAAVQNPVISSPTATASGSYTYTVTDEMGCTASNNSTATVNALPTISAITPSAITLCIGASLTLTAGSASGSGTLTSYNWSGPGYSSTGTATTAVLTPTTTAASGAYSLSVTYSTGCTSLPAVTTPSVTVNPLPTLSGITPSSTTTCTGTALTLTAGSVYGTGSPATYNWSGPNSYAATGTSTTSALTPTTTAASGNYSLSVTFPGVGCTSSIAVTSPSVTVNPAPYAGTITGAANVCVGSTVTLADTVSGGTWTSSNTSLATVAGGVVRGLSTGVVTISYSVTNSCGTAATNLAVHVNTMQWSGSTSSDWNNAANWSCGYPPGVSDNVIIPVGTSYAPTIGAAASGSTKSLTIDSGVAVTLSSSALLNVKGNLIINGTVTGPGTIIMNHTSAQSINGFGSVSNFDVNNAAGVTISSGARLTIKCVLSVTSGTLATGDSLVLYSDSTASARVAQLPSGSTITGKVKVNQYITGGRRAYRFWAHPFTASLPLSELTSYIDISGPGGSANGFTTTASNAPSSYRYTPYGGNSSIAYDPGWRPFANTNASPDSNEFKRYQGIRLYYRGSKGQGLGLGSYTVSPTVISQSGVLNQGNQDIPMQRGTSTLQDYNMIGNPYASPVDIGTVIFNAYEAGRINGSAFYIWNPFLGMAGQFMAVPYASAGHAVPYYLQANNAFQVRAMHDGDQLNFTEANKSSVISNAYSLMKANTGYVSLYLYDTTYHPYDLLQIQFNASATNKEDSRLDAAKPLVNACDFYTISEDGQKLAIDSRPYINGSTIPLGLSTTTESEFIFKAENLALPAGALLYLHDKWKDRLTLLEPGTEYRCSVPNEPTKKSTDGRFELLMDTLDNNQGTNTPWFVPTPNPAGDKVTITFSQPNLSEIGITLFNLTGTSIYTTVLAPQQSGTFTIPLTDIPPGTYIIELHLSNKKIARKLIKK